ncbi:COX15/CtaA family protein [Thioalkalivibrio sp. HK1]|uniref:COX15/CtaA family protein n=1 Tax=Thioalkalivibrio sp. HK1 TaxID=1469245 RepID=UPI001E3D1D17|nr:COX15/CtaA family protein [Thioalkalivibrio sp. HK1]
MTTSSIDSFGPDARYGAHIEAKDKRDRLVRAVGWWLIVCAGLVSVMVVVGGLTRLTGSGLSMVRWEPISGTIPPIGDHAWQIEFDAYRASPEYRLINRGMSLEDFKGIFWMEYAHRLLGRALGLAFALPFLFFLVRRAIPPGMILPISGLFVLGAAQGFLGWYMVKSGLVDEPRVSPLRLAAHLGLAAAILVGLLASGLRILAPQASALSRTRSATPAGTSRGLGFSPGFAPKTALARRLTIAATVMVFATLIVGAIVAGLDAGLVYPTFPKMGAFWIPPGILDLSPWWNNLWENPVAAQFVHRWLAMLTVLSIAGAWVAIVGIEGRRKVRSMAHACLLMALLQAGLGISTLLLHVPIAVAAAHQFGAILLLSGLVALIHFLPGSSEHPA